MTKITYIITRSDVIGGANVHLLDLIPHVAQQGFEVELLIGGNGIVYERALQLGIPAYPIHNLVREIDLKKDYQAYKEITTHLRQSNPAVVHLHSSKAGVLGRLAARKLSIPAVFTAHGWAFTEGVSKSRRILYRAIEKHFALYTNKIITVSEYDRNLALKNNVGSPEQLITIHNGLPKETAQRQRFQSNTCKLIMVARFDTQKDQMSLLQALTHLKDHDWRLTLIGDGPMLDVCKRFAISNSLEDKVFFLGQRDDVAQQLANADIFILTSHWEGFPISILEAMRAGLPVIASDVGGVSEAVLDQKTGFTIPRSDEQTLTKRLELLISHTKTREALGQAGRKRFLEFFTIDRMVSKTIQVYDEAIA